MTWSLDPTSIYYIRTNTEESVRIKTLQGFLFLGNESKTGVSFYRCYPLLFVDWEKDVVPIERTQNKTPRLVPESDYTTVFVLDKKSVRLGNKGCVNSCHVLVRRQQEESLTKNFPSSFMMCHQGGYKVTDTGDSFLHLLLKENLTVSTTTLIL